MIAIENARLLNELRERTDELARSVEELKALSEVGQAVSATLDIGAVLSTILNRSVGLTDSDAGAIFRYRRRTRSFRLFEAVGWDAALTEQIRKLDIAEDATGLGNATARRVSLQIPDLERRAGNPLRDHDLGRRLPFRADRAAGRRRTASSARSCCSAALPANSRKRACG